MSRPVIYIAGPYTAHTHIGVERNVLAAKEASIELLRRGWAVVCPHTMTHTCEIGTELEPEVFYESDLEILKRCDAIVMIGVWQGSKGSMVELEKAREWGLTVYLDMFNVPEVGK